MNKLLRSPIAAKHRASQAGVLPSGALQFARQTAKQLASELPRAVKHALVPMGRDPRPTVRAPCLRGPAFYHSGSLLRKLLSNSLANCPRPNLATLLHE